MNKFAIISDASCDVSKEMKKEYDIITINGHVTLPDRSEVSEFINWNKTNREQFYKDLSKNPDGYVTSPPNVDEFAAAFEKCIENGQDVMVITISGAISGAFDFATQAKKQVAEKYPNAKIIIVDSLRFSIAHGLLVILAAKLRENGHSIEEAAAYIEENKNRVHQCGWLDDLSFVAKKDIENTIENASEQTIFIAQTNRLAPAEKYKEMILERFKPKAVEIVDVYPFCGVNVGPGLMAAYYVGKPISKGLDQEKELIQKLIEAQG